MRIKETATLAKKFVQRAGAAAGEYKTGVEGAGQAWQANTEAADQNYATGVQEAITSGRFKKGVAAAGSAKFTTRASTLGAQRFPTGIAASENEWAKGAAPYLDAMKNMQLPPRRAKGSPENLLRAGAVAQRLRDIKVGR